MGGWLQLRFKYASVFGQVYQNFAQYYSIPVPELSLRATEVSKTVYPPLGTHGPATRVRIECTVAV